MDSQLCTGDIHATVGQLLISCAVSILFSMIQPGKILRTVIITFAVILLMGGGIVWAGYLLLLADKLSPVAMNPWSWFILVILTPMVNLLWVTRQRGQGMLLPYGQKQIERSAEEQRILAIAQFDKVKIEWSVRVDSCRIEPHLKAVPARVHFRFHVANGSVYPVSINKVEGTIQYGERQLTRNIDLSTQWKIKNLMPRHVGYVEIIQSFSQEETDILQQDWDNQSFKTYFTFKQLRLIVSDAEEAGRIIPEPLDLTRISGIALNSALK